MNAELERQVEGKGAVAASGATSPMSDAPDRGDAGGPAAAAPVDMTPPQGPDHHAPSRAMIWSEGALVATALMMLRRKKRLKAVLTLAAAAMAYSNGRGARRPRQ